MNSQADNLEFAVSQAVDGLLSDFDRRALGDRLAGPDGQALTAQYARLNVLLRTHAVVPAVNLDAFADSFFATLAAEDAHAPAAIPIRGTWTRRLAAAAAVALTALAAWPFLPHRAQPANSQGEAVVQIVAPAAPAATPVVSIQVGPSETAARRGTTITLEPKSQTPATPKVVISGVPPAGDARPY